MIVGYDYVQLSILSWVGHVARDHYGGLLGMIELPNPLRARRVLDAGLQLLLPFFTLAARLIFEPPPKRTRRQRGGPRCHGGNDTAGGYETTGSDNAIQGVRRFHTFDPL